MCCSTDLSDGSEITFCFVLFLPNSVFCRSTAFKNFKWLGKALNMLANLFNNVN